MPQTHTKDLILWWGVPWAQGPLLWWDDYSNQNTATAFSFTCPLLSDLLNAPEKLIDIILEKSTSQQMLTCRSSPLSAEPEEGGGFAQENSGFWKLNTIKADRMVLMAIYSVSLVLVAFFRA